MILSSWDKLCIRSENFCGKQSFIPVRSEALVGLQIGAELKNIHFNSSIKISMFG